MALEGWKGLAGGGNDSPPVQLTYEGSHRFRAQVSLSQGGYLVVAEMYYPGWKATEGGLSLPLFRADGAFCAVELSPGDHRVDFEYRPDSFERGRAITAVTLLVAVILWFSPQFRRIRDAH